MPPNHPFEKSRPSQKQPHGPTFVILIALHFVATSSQSPESSRLIEFARQFKNQSAFGTWVSSSNPCSQKGTRWVGVTCNVGNVFGLRLENMGLTGTVCLDSLKDLSKIRTLSLMNNSLTGTLPNSTILPALKSLFLSNNEFQGMLSEAMFANAHNMKKLHLANNKFSGPIPTTLVNLRNLFELKLENNGFEGALPDLRAIKLLNVSYNKLSGKIPSGMSKLGLSSFYGNPKLCGPPLKNPCSVSEPKKSKSVPLALIISLSTFVGLIVLIGIIALATIFHRNQRSSEAFLIDSMEDPVVLMPSRVGKKTTEGKGEESKLIFLKELEDGQERFEICDLLKASAVVLGSGFFGCSYKAGLENGQVSVVKRYNQMNGVGREVFDEHMKRLGSLSHPNLLRLVAYYYRIEEKLVVTDFVPNGNLAIHLHGEAQLSLDWPTRLKIVKGVARGLAYLYEELPNLITPHGNLKSSNVLLSDKLDPMLSDYALVPIINQENVNQALLAYKSPEYRSVNRLTKKTDVWCFGILVLEILTGKFLQHESNTSSEMQAFDLDFSSWSAYVMSEMEAGNHVFDESMESGGEEEMAKLLRIGIECCQDDVDKRWDIREAVERIEEIKDFK